MSAGIAQLRDTDDVVLRAAHLEVEFPVGTSQARVHALSDVSFDVARGETLSVVGESGSGKSTLARAVLRLVQLKRGQIQFRDLELSKLSGESLRAVRPRIQIVLQDPVAALNPRRRIKDIVGEPLRVWNVGTKEERAKLVDQTLAEVGLDPVAVRDRQSYQLSGGQCQRVNIARALVLKPEVLVCDEPVSSLDVSLQAQLLNLLADLRDKLGLTVIFISHDLAVVRSISDRVLVMYLGKICEVSDDLDAMYREPAHPYTAMLLASAPRALASRHPHSISGEAPSPIDPPSGCRFRTRCPRAQSVCAEVEPEIRELRRGRFAACHFPLIEPEQS